MNDGQEYRLRWRGREIGPYPLSEIDRRLDAHEIGLGHEIYGQDRWMTLEEFFASLPKPASAAPAAAPAPVLPPPPKPALKIAPAERASPVRIKVSVRKEEAASTADSAVRGHRPARRLAFALLGVFVGFSGVHNFYARHYLTGLLQLLLSVATYLMGFGIIASWLWAMVEAVTVRRDGNGNDMI